MIRNKYRKMLIVFIALLLLIVASISIYWLLVLQKAHSTFNDYYDFRGCVKLIGKKSSYGTCELNSGKVIKIVKYQNKWYVDGDLPTGFLSL